MAGATGSYASSTAWTDGSIVSDHAGSPRPRSPTLSGCRIAPCACDLRGPMRGCACACSSFSRPAAMGTDIEADPFGITGHGEPPIEDVVADFILKREENRNPSLDEYFARYPRYAEQL